MIKMLLLGGLIYGLVILIRKPAKKSSNQPLDASEIKRSKDDDTELADYEEIE